jgi:hypothetical protein
MLKRYVYKNVNGRPVNIGGYQFKENGSLESDILISGFNEAVSNGFLELSEVEPEFVNRDAAQARQTGDTCKVKIIFHMGTDANGGEILEEIESAPSAPVDFFSADLNDLLLRENEVFDCWFKDTEFTKPVRVDKTRSPKDGEVHFYGKFSPKPEDPYISKDPDEPAKPDVDSGGQEKDGSPLSSPPIGDETLMSGSESE